MNKTIKNVLLSLSLFTFGLSIFILTSCKSSKKHDIEIIAKLEADINNSMSLKFDEKKAVAYIDACKKFANDYATDTASASYLFKAGRIAMNLQESEKANESIIIFDKLLKEFPNAKDAPLAMFMKAFYLENNLKNIKMAEETYREFLRKYPKHQLAPDAQKSLEYIGKPIETIIKEFKEKNGDTLATKAAEKKK